MFFVLEVLIPDGDMFAGSGSFWVSLQLPEMLGAVPRALPNRVVAETADEAADIAVVVPWAGAVYFVCRRFSTGVACGAHFAGAIGFQRV